MERQIWPQLCAAPIIKNTQSEPRHKYNTVQESFSAKTKQLSCSTSSLQTRTTEPLSCVGGKPYGRRVDGYNRAFSTAIWKVPDCKCLGMYSTRRRLSRKQAEQFLRGMYFWQHVRSLSVGRQVRSASSASSVSSASRQVSEANKCVVYVRSYVCPRVVQVCSVV